MKQLQELIQTQLGIIYDRYDDFVSYFVQQDVMSVYEISFCSKNIYFVWCNYDGSHCSDSTTIENYVKWRDGA